MYVIRDKAGNYLSEPAKFRGSQAGVASVWSEQLADALFFMTEDDAEDAMYRLTASVLPGYLRVECVMDANTVPEIQSVRDRVKAAWLDWYGDDLGFESWFTSQVRAVVAKSEVGL